MDLVVSGKAVFRIIDDETQEEVEIELSADDVEIETCIHDADRQMGAEFVHLVCGHVGGIEVEWQIYEYPEGEINHIESPERPECVRDFKFSLA